MPNKKIIVMYEKLLQKSKNGGLTKDEFKTFLKLHNAKVLKENSIVKHK